MFLLYSLSLGAPIWPIGVGGPRVRPVRAHSSYATGSSAPPLEYGPYTGFVDTLCCFSHLLTAHPPKISGTTPVKNMKIRLWVTHT
jgi:hypothetical protein